LQLFRGARSQFMCHGIFLNCETGDPQSLLLCCRLGLWNCSVRFLLAVDLIHRES